MSPSGLYSERVPPPRTILVVDDEVLVRATICAYLRECGYRVIEASQSDEASALLQAREFVVDVVLTHIDAGQAGSAFGLAAWIRANAASVRFIMVGSAARAAKAASDLCEDGPRSRKPYDHPWVLNRIRRLLRD